MKNILPLVIIASFCSNVYGNDNVRLQGKIVHPLADSIKVSYDPTCISYQPKEYYAKLGKDGSFNISFYVPEGYNNVNITNGNQETEIFAQPGADLTLFIDGHNFDSSVHYEGKGKELANFMARHVLERHTMLYFGIEAQMLCGKEVAEYETALKELENKETDFLQKNGKNLPVSFKEYYKTYYRYKGYAAMEMYPMIHEMIKEKSNRIKNIPKENYAIINDIPQAFDDKYIDIATYQEYLYNFFSVKISSAKAIDDDTGNAQQGIDTFMTLAYKKMPPKTSEFYAGHTIFTFSKYISADKLEAEYKTYKVHFPGSRNLKILRQVISEKKRVAIGKQAIDFNITTPEGKKMKLSDLEGKVVYIDFWSSSCAPCIAEMPDAKKVREYFKFKDKPVAFINVSLDIHDSTWKKALKYFEVGGINTRVDGYWESETVKNYGVKGIPSYFLLDKKGKFAADENLARPGDTKKLIAQIEALLN